MNKYNMNQGLKRFGQSGVSAIKKELHQLITMNDLDPDNPKELRREDHRSAMAYLMLLKEKRDFTIKSQVCYVGRVQRNYMKKEETTPPPSCRRA